MAVCDCFMDAYTFLVTDETLASKLSEDRVNGTVPSRLWNTIYTKVIPATHCTTGRQTDREGDRELTESRQVRGAKVSATVCIVQWVGMICHVC